MFKSLRVRASQGTQYITDLRKASPAGFRGRPHISEAPCPTGCDACRDACPTDAIALDPVRIDLGKCVFCNECVLACPAEKISFTPEPRMAAANLAGLIVSEGDEGPRPVETSAALKKLFGRSLRLRQVSAGGCNGCELELNAVANVNFDLQRFGIEWVASPRHADAIVLTGPLTKNMADAVRLAWDAMPDPKFLIGFGACTISGGLYAAASAIDRSFLETIAPVLFIPGCPPHPLTFVHGILDLLGIAPATPSA
jgi:Ni,Fe-hydrogenase III small subunit/NAD-dependent dihydropyrimidine dehydrogenase PreA subunit